MLDEVPVAGASIDVFVRSARCSGPAAATSHQARQIQSIETRGIYKFC